MVSVHLPLNVHFGLVRHCLQVSVQVFLQLLPLIVYPDLQLVNLYFVLFEQLEVTAVQVEQFPLLGQDDKE